MDEQKPVWTTSSFLLYAGGFTVLGAALGALGYLSTQYGNGGYAGWSLLVLAVLYGIALGHRRRGRRIAAGIFAFASLVAWAAFVAALWTWFGWLHPHGVPATVMSGGIVVPRVSTSVSASLFAGFSVARLSLAFLVLAAAWHGRRLFGFPLLRAVSAVVGWYFVTDLVSGGGTWSTVVTLLVGLAYLAMGSGSDDPSAFWLHLVGGVLIGGALLQWWHSGDWRWALIAVASLVYVAIARGTGRSSWAVLGAVGLLMASWHFAFEWAVRAHTTRHGDFSRYYVTFHVWVYPLVFAFTGFLLVALGLRTRDTSDH